MSDYPHCDSSVLHAPGECRYCDACPEQQQMRIDRGVNFTGHDDPNLLADPATQKRSLEKINSWYGNVPVAEGEPIPMPFTLTLIDASPGVTLQDYGREVPVRTVRRRLKGFLRFIGSLFI